MKRRLIACFIATLTVSTVCNPNENPIKLIKNTPEVIHTPGEQDPSPDDLTVRQNQVSDVNRVKLNQLLKQVADLATELLVIESIIDNSSSVACCSTINEIDSKIDALTVLDTAINSKLDYLITLSC